ncbi:MAG: sulfatase [Gammaproteobacteria bacterium]|nr:sulfatase [Gammaproteobacteria bacterium]
MKAIVVMYDSLNRHMLSSYGCDWTLTPNVSRLAERAVTFDTHYVGSMPCMPARREMHTGRHNFLHRGWGPWEPFDDSCFWQMSRNGIYTHLVSDHYHYWEDGGMTYHHRYNSWVNVRGHEGDRWKGEVKDPAIPEHLGRVDRHDLINRKYMQREELTPQARTFAEGLEFLETNHQEDNWYLQIETFDPHEPFFTLDEWKNRYNHEWDGPHFDWPKYDRVTESPQAVEHMQYEYAALLTQCDHYLGKVLDAMDRYNLWDDTMLIVMTDHGFLLGEHDWWAKMRMPMYDEIANIPFFVWDPRVGKAGERRKSLTQTIDVAPTLLDYFGIGIPEDMMGVSLRGVVDNDTPIREYGIYGLFGGHVNVTDGRHVYMRAPGSENGPLYHYTLMPTHMRTPFRKEELRQMTVHAPLSFTKGCPVMRIPSQISPVAADDFVTKLFDKQTDPGQDKPLDDAALESDMVGKLIEAMQVADAPAEQYERLELEV